MEFPTTHWTMLAQATLHGDSAASKALESFILRYREPVMRVIRSRGVVESRVEDLTHDFFLRLMQNSTLRQADPARGRFRGFLGSALKYFLADDMDHNHAQKRGGGVLHLPLDGHEESLAGETNGAENTLLDYHWALHILQTCLTTIRDEWDAAGKSGRFAVLRQYLPGGACEGNQAEAASRLGISDTALRSEISRLRARFREILRSEVAATLSSPDEVEDEMRHLHTALSHPGIELPEEKSLPQAAAVS